MLKKKEKNMNESAASQVKSFVESVDNFYDEVGSWVESSNLIVIRQKIEISEEYSGNYTCNKLLLKGESGKLIAEIVPVGTFIIGGNGRIDLNGTFDKAIIVNLESGGPSMTSTITVGTHTESKKTSFYKGVEKQGWYWIEDRRRGKANFMNKEIFNELLREVSDYDLS